MFDSIKAGLRTYHEARKARLDIQRALVAIEDAPVLVCVDYDERSFDVIPQRGAFVANLIVPPYKDRDPAAVYG